MPKKLDRDRILAFVSIQVNEYYHNQGKIPYITRIREFSMVLFFFDDTAIVFIPLRLFIKISNHLEYYEDLINLIYLYIRNFLM